MCVKNSRSRIKRKKLHTASQESHLTRQKAYKASSSLIMNKIKKLMDIHVY